MKIETISLEDKFGVWHEDLRVCINPRDLAQLAKGLRIDLDKPEGFYHTLRAIVDPVSTDAYIWCAGKGTHDAVSEQLGFDYRGCYYQNITKTDSEWTAEWMAGATTDQMPLEIMYRCEKKIASLFGIEIDPRYCFDGELLVEPDDAVGEEPVGELHETVPPVEPDLTDPEYTPEKWKEMVEFFKVERGKFYRGCIFEDCMHTIAAKFLGSYNGDHQYDHDTESDCCGCKMAHFRLGCCCQVQAGSGSCSLGR